MAKNKKFRINWIDECGNIMMLEELTTSNPVNALFNAICKMITTAPAIFPIEGKSESIREWIKAGRFNHIRNHYFAEIGEQVLTIIETA